MTGREWWNWAGNWMAFGPLGGRHRFFESGQVRLAILSLLDEGPKHGYEIMKELEARSGGLYRASAGTVYPTLQLLEDEDLISSEQSGGKKVYRITEGGRRELRSERDEVRNIWRRAAGWHDWSKNVGPEVAFVIGPLGELMKATFRAVSHIDDPDRARLAREILERARTEMEGLFERRR